jgi:hypothetical protein
MAPKPATTLAMAGLLALALFSPGSSSAIEVKKSLFSNAGPSGPSAPGPAKENPIPAAQRQQLSDTVASESDSYLNDESEKKSSGKPYVDLEHAKFLYLPTMKEGKWTVLAKLQAPEYTPPKSGEGKGKATGKQRVLIFNYKLEGSKWTEVEPPKWQDVDVNGNPVVAAAPGAAGAPAAAAAAAPAKKK